jgi:hypothetical protein
VDEFLEAVRPIVEVLLIAELAVLEACVAPLDAALFPPAAHRFSAVALEGHELHAVLTRGRRLIVFGCVAVIRDQHVRARSPELVEDRRRILAEPDVGVDVGDATNRRSASKTKRGVNGVSVQQYSPRPRCGLTARSSGVSSAESLSKLQCGSSNR